MSDLRVTTAWEDGLCLAGLDGEARMETIGELEDVAAEAERRGVPSMLLDLSGVEFMDSAATGSLLRLHNRLEAEGGALVMYGAPRRVEKLFDRLGMHQFRMAGDEVAARATLP